MSDSDHSDDMRSSESDDDYEFPKQQESSETW